MKGERIDAILAPYMRNPSRAMLQCRFCNDDIPSDGPAICVLCKGEIEKVIIDLVKYSVQSG